MGFIARAFEHYAGLPHQKDAVAKLEGMLNPAQVAAFANTFSPKPKIATLSVPFYSQLDNTHAPLRTCNPSSCAMALEYLRPGAIKGDDNRLVRAFLDRRFDFTNHQQMTIVLRSFGCESVFRYDLSKEKLKDEIKSGRPVVIGILHNGPAANPWGGHMVCAVGMDDDALVVHDPYGSLMNGYSGKASEGRFVRYPWEELEPRWLVEHPQSGWGRLFLPLTAKEPPDAHELFRTA